MDGNVELDEDGLQTYRAVAQEPFPILFQAGYLTIKEYIKDLRLYRLGFPNNEVRYGFLHNLLPAYSSVPFGQTGVSVARFVQDMKYASQYKTEGQKIVLIGASFDEQTRTIKAWVVDNP